MTYSSSCHCGDVSATIEGDLPDAAMSCNCSICRRKGHILHFVSASAVRIDAPEDMLSDYMFGKQRIHHHFCSTCGCSPFGRGTDDKGNEMIAVNLRCVPECDLDALELNRIDGASF